jgi:hypothetical protein
MHGSETSKKGFRMFIEVTNMFREVMQKLKLFNFECTKLLDLTASLPQAITCKESHVV